MTLLASELSNSRVVFSRLKCFRGLLVSVAGVTCERHAADPYMRVFRSSTGKSAYRMDQSLSPTGEGLVFEDAISSQMYMLRF